MNNTQTKTALITGASRRIGKAITEKLHQQGYQVLIHFNNSEAEAQNLASKLNHQRKNSAHLIQGNLNEVDSVNDIIKQGKQYTDLCLLVNNASSFYPTPIGEGTEQHWHDLFSSNSKAPFFLTQGLHKTLKQNCGNIINIVDIHSRKPMPEHTIYTMAKASLEMLTKSLAKELAPDIRVNGVSPGAILWPENGSDLQKEILAKIPLEKSGEPEDIAEAVNFLAHANYITGQILAVDGGRSLNM